MCSAGSMQCDAMPAPSSSVVKHEVLAWLVEMMVAVTTRSNPPRGPYSRGVGGLSLCQRFTAKRIRSQQTAGAKQCWLGAGEILIKEAAEACSSESEANQTSHQTWRPGHEIISMCMQENPC